MTEWQPIKTAPVDEWVPVWGNGRLRFMRQDSLGQWRNGFGRPRETPKLWYLLPLPTDAALDHPKG